MALYIRSLGEIKCGMVGVPWVSARDYIDEIELFYKQEIGECRNCPSLLLAIKMKKQDEKKTISTTI